MSVAASDAILERLVKIYPKGIDLALHRLERLLRLLGNPERAMPPVFHVAGTNGKGSTCAFLRAMLEADGKRVHVYTSPHLVRFNERIRLAGTLISDEELVDSLSECERINDGGEITFFEILMAAAFLAFSRHPADALVLEVGLGGKYDATNVIARPVMTVITPVGLDHAEFLGTSLASIAAEKAGIVKRGAPLVLGNQDDVPRDVITRTADVLCAPLFAFGQEFFAHQEQGRMIYQDDAGLLDLPLPKLVGQHQIENAATAIAALRHAGPGWVNERAIEQGLRSVEWPARLQRLTRGPLIAYAPAGAEVWLDGGHNPHGAAAVARTMADMEERSPKPLYLIAGMLKTKDASGFLAAFYGLAKHVTTVGIPTQEASFGAGNLYDVARDVGLEANPAEDMEDAMIQVAAWCGARTMDGPPRILICGSLYLAGHVLRTHG